MRKEIPFILWAEGMVMVIIAILIPTTPYPSYLNLMDSILSILAILFFALTFIANYLIYKESKTENQEG